MIFSTELLVQIVLSGLMVGVLYALMDAVVDRYFPIIDTLESELEDIEAQIFTPGAARSNIEQLYALKTAASGSLLTRHLPIRVDRYGHCQFTAGEALVSFALMLFYDASLQEVSGVATTLSGAEGSPTINGGKSSTGPAACQAPTPGCQGWLRY